MRVTMEKIETIIPIPYEDVYFEIHYQSASGLRPVAYLARAGRIAVAVVVDDGNVSVLRCATPTGPFGTGEGLAVLGRFRDFESGVEALEAEVELSDAYDAYGDGVGPLDWGLSW